MKTLRVLLWPLILFCFAVVYVALAVTRFKDGDGAKAVLELLMGFSAFVLALWQSLYSGWVPFRLAVERYKCLWRNTDMQWNLHAHYVTNLREGLDTAIEDAILSAYPDRVRFEKVANRITARINALLCLEIEADASSSRTVVDLNLMDQSTTYRQSEHLLEEHIAPLLEKIAGAIKPEAGQTCLNLGIRLRGKNPYLALYANTTPPESIEEFRILISEKDAKVTITKDSIEVSANSLQTFRILVKQYSHFSRPGGERNG